MSLVSRVAARYLQATDAWLPDYLGPGAPAEDFAARLVKEIAGASSPPRDPKAVAGGLFYATLDAARLNVDAQKLWSLLDASGGLYIGKEMPAFGQRIFNALTVGPPVSRDVLVLRVGGIGVALLQRTRQQRKAQVVNQYFVEKYGSALSGMQVGRDKPKTPQEILNEEITPEITRKARQVAKKLGGDAKKALGLLAYVAQDINFSSLVDVALAAGPSEHLTHADLDMLGIRSLGQFLDWSADAVIAFGIVLLRTMGATQELARYTRMALSVAKQNGLLTNRMAASYDGNPNGQPIYPEQVGHGYGEPLAGGTDVMRRLQNRLLHEQGRSERPESPRLATILPTIWD